MSREDTLVQSKVSHRDILAQSNSRHSTFKCYLNDGSHDGGLLAFKTCRALCFKKPPSSFHVPPAGLAGGASPPSRVHSSSRARPAPRLARGGAGSITGRGVYNSNSKKQKLELKTVIKVKFENSDKKLRICKIH